MGEENGFFSFVFMCTLLEWTSLVDQSIINQLMAHKMISIRVESLTLWYSPTSIWDFNYQSTVLNSMV